MMGDTYQRNSAVEGGFVHNGPEDNQTSSREYKDNSAIEVGFHHNGPEHNNRTEDESQHNSANQGGLIRNGPEVNKTTGGTNIHNTCKDSFAYFCFTGNKVLVGVLGLVVVIVAIVLRIMFTQTTKQSTNDICCEQWSHLVGVLKMTTTLSQHDSRKGQQPGGDTVTSLL